MQTVFLVVYSHRHGDDYFICSDQGASERCTLEIMQTNAYEFGIDEVKQGIHHDEWLKLTEGQEEITVNEMEVKGY